MPESLQGRQKLQKQIPRRLKPVRDDKNMELYGAAEAAPLQN
jgi:hypothetical protein